MSALRVDEDGVRQRRSAGSERETPADEHQDSVRARQPRRDRRTEAAQSRLSRVPFVLVLIVIFGVGMAGLLALNTSLQGQSFQARELHDRADKLDHRETALNRKAQDLRAPDRLADQAWKLGLRPNSGHAVLELPNGKIVGKPRTAGKNPIPGLKPKSAKSKSDSSTAHSSSKAEQQKKKQQKKKQQKKKQQKTKQQNADTHRTNSGQHKSNKDKQNNKKNKDSGHERTSKHSEGSRHDSRGPGSRQGN